LASRFEKLMQKAEKQTLSVALAAALREAVVADDTELATWLRLELLGYVEGTPGFTDQTVPNYRAVKGQWCDEFRRPLVITDPEQQYLNEAGLRAGVTELESIASAQGQVVMGFPELALIIRHNFGAEVSQFRFSPQSVAQVLANIRAQLINHLATHRHQLEEVSTAVYGRQGEEIIELRPNFYGIGINLKALWRKIRSLPDGE